MTVLQLAGFVHFSGRNLLRLLPRQTRASLQKSTMILQERKTGIWMISKDLCNREYGVGVEQHIDEPHIDEASAVYMTRCSGWCLQLLTCMRCRDITIDVPQKDHVRFRGTLLCDLETQFDTLRQRFEQFYTPLVRDQNGEVFLIGLPRFFGRNRPIPSSISSLHRHHLQHLARRRVV